MLLPDKFTFIIRLFDRIADISDKNDTNSFYLRTFANRKQLVGLSLVLICTRGKSGQHRASYFLTESCLQR